MSKRSEIFINQLRCRVCGALFPVRRRLDGMVATVTSCGNAGSVIEHIEREHPDEFRGVGCECAELRHQNLLGLVGGR